MSNAGSPRQGAGSIATNPRLRRRRGRLPPSGRREGEQSELRQRRVANASCVHARTARARSARRGRAAVRSSSDRVEKVGDVVSDRSIRRIKHPVTV